MMIVVLVLFPVLVAIGGLVLAALLGALLNQDAADRNQDSELLDLNT